MDIVAIIPARYASTRFPGKPLVEIAGKPMIQHVVERTQACPLIEHVIVATDDTRIESAVRQFGGEVIRTRADHPSGTDRVAEVAENCEADIIVNVQGDEPLIDPQALEAAIQPLIDHLQVMMSTLASPIRTETELHNPNIVKVVLDINQFALYFSRAPVPYPRDGFAPELQSFYRHIGVYVYRRKFLLNLTKFNPTPLEQTEKLEQLRVLENGHQIKVVLTDYVSIGVDTPEDLALIHARLAGCGINTSDK